ncbi:uncharacterized protein EDB93DRAFT_1247980 [Suillus bovinus]|uniref:uncharacterized protein n=1 Tax=Suillus bovinus TaxID=48563 RepID=UPI001B86B0A5|nr:uncharacterized protein EDB93DRAFT_1247980 [Suillus bovinus]KAG2155026.1 hypothetical protein EDB93DRAFT_1247980 [Suillus bovinus]
MPPKAPAKKWCPTRRNAKTIKKPGCRLNINPSLQPDSSQLGLYEEYMQPLQLFNDLSAMVEEQEEDEDEDEEDADAEKEDHNNSDEVNDEHGLHQEHYHPLPYNNPSSSRPYLEQNYAPPYYPPLSPQPQMYDGLLPSSPICDFLPFDYTPMFDNRPESSNVPSSSWQPARTSLGVYDNYLSHVPMFDDNYLSHAPTFDDLIPSVIQDLEPITSSRFSGIEQMRREHLERQRVRCAVQARINLPGIKRVFVYNPRCHPAESQQGQLITTGIIRGDADLPQQLTEKERKESMKEAKHNTQMAEEAFLEAVGRVAPGVSLTTLQIPDHVESCKKLSTIMTTVCGVFKKEARCALPNHYSLTIKAEDMGSLIAHREATVAPLLINHTYLFKDLTIMSPVNHPTVIETIYHALWTTSLHESLNFDELD